MFSLPPPPPPLPLPLDPLELLAVFMQMDTRELLMRYIDLKHTNDVQLTFDSLLVIIIIITDLIV